MLIRNANYQFFPQPRTALWLLPLMQLALSLNYRKPKEEDPAAPLPGINQQFILVYTWDWHSAFMHR